MGIMDRLKGELIDVIEWLEEDESTIAYRFERWGNEIKNGAQLIVREGQMAIFVHEGQLADIFSPGTYELETQNLPILTTLKGWKYGFKSPFKAEVYFVTSRTVTGFGWGTPSPFRLRDPEFGIMEMTARGSFAVHVVDHPKFLRSVVGTDGEITKDEIKDRLRRKFVTEAISAIAESGKSFYELSSDYDGLSLALKGRVESTFVELYGIAIDESLVASIDLTERSAEKVESRDALLFADQHLSTYERKARADAMIAMANNPGSGGLGAGAIGMGMGMGLGGQMAGMYAPAMGAAAQQPPAAAPPPPPAGFHVLVNGQQMGPVPVQQLAQMIQAGQANAATNVWKPGMAAWAPASSVPELLPLFQTPPPPPVGPPSPPAAPPVPPAPPTSPVTG